MSKLILMLAMMAVVMQPAVGIAEGDASNDLDADVLQVMVRQLKARVRHLEQQNERLAEAVNDLETEKARLTEKADEAAVDRLKVMRFLAARDLNEEFSQWSRDTKIAAEKQQRQGKIDDAGDELSRLAGKSIYEVGDFRYMVAGARWLDDFGQMEPPNHHYLIVFMVALNNGNEPESLPRIHLVDDKNRRFNAVTRRLIFTTGDTFTPLLDVNPGTSTEGTALFDVPRNGKYKVLMYRNWMDSAQARNPTRSAELSDHIRLTNKLESLPDPDEIEASR